MKNAIIYAAVLAAFALMVVEPYFITWGLIFAAVVLGTAEWSKRFR